MSIIESVLADPAGQISIVPFAVAFAAALLLVLSRAGAMAALAIGAGFFAAYYVIYGSFPAFLPVATKDKVFYVAAASLALGFALDAAGHARAGGHLFAFLLPAAVLWWLRQNQIAAGPSAALVATLTVLFLVSVLVYWRQAASARGRDTSEARSAALFPAIQVLVAAVGLGGVALLGISLGYGSLGIALAASSGGYLLVSYFAHVFANRALGYDATGAFGAGGVWLVLACGAVFESDAPVKLVLLGVVALAFAADFLARPLALSVFSGALARITQPLVYGAIVAVPPAAALAYAWLVLGWRMG